MLEHRQRFLASHEVLENYQHDLLQTPVLVINASCDSVYLQSVDPSMRGYSEF